MGDGLQLLFSIDGTHAFLRRRAVVWWVGREAGVAGLL